MGQFSDRLQQMKKHWEGAREDAGFQDLPPDKYQAWVMAELMESSNGNFGLLWKFQVARGELAGRKQVSWQGLENVEQLPFLARSLARLEYEVNELDIEALESIVDEINDAPPLVMLQVREKDGYTNCYINKLLDRDQYDDLTDPDWDGGGANKPKPTGKAASSGSTTKSSQSAAPTRAANWAAVGQMIENGDMSETHATAKEMVKVGAELGLDPDAFGWAEFGVEIDRLLVEKVDARHNVGEADASWSDWGNAIEAGELADDGDEATQMIEAANGYSLDPDEFGWAELGTKLDELDAGGGDDSGDGEVTVGANVWGVHKGKPVQGKVEAVKGDTATIKTNDGKKIDLPVARLEVSKTPF